MLRCLGAEERPLTSIPFGWIGQTALASASRGIDIEGQLLQLGINAGGASIGPETPISPAEYLLMCVRVINAVDDEMHGATQARMRRGTAALGVKLLGTGANLGTAIGSLFRFYEIAGGFCHAELARDERKAIIRIRADSELSDLTTVVEEMMATHLHMLFSCYLDFFLPLSEFSTTSVHHPRLGARHPYLGAPVVLGRITQMTFPASYLDLPSKAVFSEKGPLDAALHWLGCFGPGLGGEVDPTLKGEISALVYEALLSEDLALQDCCAVIGLQPRALRAALFAEGSSYRRLRRGALVERVRPYIEAQVTADDMAFGLGYSDARSLRRALKGATGMSLGEMRRPVACPTSPVNAALVQNLRSEMALMA